MLFESQRMNELTLTLGPVETENLRASTCCPAIWACSHFPEMAHTSLPYPCDFVPAALLPQTACPHLFTWRIFHYLWTFCYRLPASVLLSPPPPSGRADRYAYMYLFIASFNNKCCYDSDNYNVWSAFTVLIALCMILFLSCQAVRWALLLGHKDN